MPISQALQQDDLAQKFDDWGETVTLRTFDQTYDPETQQVVETTSDTTVVGVVTVISIDPAKETGGQFKNEMVAVLLRSDGLPAIPPTSRIVYQAVEYDVLEMSQVQGGLVHLFHCRKVS